MLQLVKCAHAGLRVWVDCHVEMAPSGFQLQACDSSCVYNSHPTHLNHMGSALDFASKCVATPPSHALGHVSGRNVPPLAEEFLLAGPGAPGHLAKRASVLLPGRLSSTKREIYKLCYPLPPTMEVQKDPFIFELGGPSKGTTPNMSFRISANFTIIPKAELRLESPDRGSLSW